MGSQPETPPYLARSVRAGNCLFSQVVMARQNWLRRVYELAPPTTGRS